MIEGQPLAPVPDALIWVEMTTRQTVWSGEGQDRSLGDQWSVLKIQMDADGVLVRLSGTDYGGTERFTWREVVQALVDFRTGLFGIDGQFWHDGFRQALVELGFQVPWAPAHAWYEGAFIDTDAEEDEGEEDDETDDNGVRLGTGLRVPPEVMAEIDASLDSWKQEVRANLLQQHEPEVSENSDQEDSGDAGMDSAWGNGPTRSENDTESDVTSATVPAPLNVQIWSRERVFFGHEAESPIEEAWNSLSIGPDGGGILLSLTGTKGSASGRFTWREVVQALVLSRRGLFGIDGQRLHDVYRQGLADLGFSVP